MTANIAISTIMELPMQDRIEAVQTILDSIAADSPRPQISEEFKDELRRRRDEARSQPKAGIPWEEIRDASLARVQE